ncbi:hypothetical protein CRUP_032188, partial [Coryphaenoides rupestris]
GARSEDTYSRTSLVYGFMVLDSKAMGSPVFVDFNSSGTCVAASGEDSTLRIWDLRTNKLTHLYQVHSAVVNCFSFHPSNNYLISGSSDGTVKMADLHEGHVMYTLHGHKGCVLTTVFSRSGEEFVTGGADGQVLVWRTNLDRGRYRDVLRGHGRRCAPDLSARLAHLHPGVAHLRRPPPCTIEIAPTLVNTVSREHHIVDQTFQTFHSQSITFSCDLF